MHHLRLSLSSLSDKLALAQVGILHTNLISSRTLGRVLRRIGKALPANFALPYPLTQINDYIRIAKTKLIRLSNSNHVLFYVPLLYTLNDFTIYRFFPYQVPLLDHNVSLAYVPNEPRFLLISENRQQYIQPSDADMQSCIRENHPFCQLHEPAYSTADATSCIVNLFRRQRPTIEKFCAPVIRPTNDAPKAYYPTDGKWLIVSPVLLALPLSVHKLPGLKPSIRLSKLSLLIWNVPQPVIPSTSHRTTPARPHLDLPDFQPILLRYLVNDTDTVPIWRSKWASSLDLFPRHYLASPAPR